MSTATHANVVSYIDYFIENGHHYLVVAYADGIDIGSLVLQKREAIRSGSNQHPATGVRGTAATFIA